MKKRILSALIVGMVAATTLVGCGNSGSSSSNNKLVISTWD